MRLVVLGASGFLPFVAGSRLCRALRIPGLGFAGMLLLVRGVGLGFWV